MSEKKLKSGTIGYYWAPPTRDLNAGCPVSREPLGNDYATAVGRARFLNSYLDAWRAGRSGVVLDCTRMGFGTVGWLFNTYLNSNAFRERVSERSQPEYRRALRRIEELSTTNGEYVRDLPALSLSPGAVDKIYRRLRDGRKRQANLAIDIARRAWDVVWRLHPEQVAEKNPWRGVERDLTRQTKPAATREEAYALANALRDIGEPHLGAAAIICFELHQRPEHIRKGDITWRDWRPESRPQHAYVRHPKTGAKGWIPLEDEYGQLFPDLDAYLAELKPLGLPIVLTSGRRGPPRPYSAEHAQRKVREARKSANLGTHVTLDSCRHGGLTELGDAGLSEQEIMALSMHRSPDAARGYVKKTEEQRIHGLRKRRTYVAGTKEAQESE